MLAYVFWHQPRPDVSPADYETALHEFQAALGADRPSGFQRAVVFRANAIPWAGTTDPCWEDWYVLDGSAALDPLNDAAVSGSRQGPHDAAAATAAWGTAGLYHRQMGTLPVEEARHAVWFAKPPGVKYHALWDRLDPLIDVTPAALWQRHMVLGPSPEFCILSPRAVDIAGIIEEVHGWEIEKVV